MREKICLDKEWYCHLGDISSPPKTVLTSGEICGYAGPLESESFEPYSGALRHLERLHFMREPFGFRFEAETPYKAVLKSKGLEQPYSMEEADGWKKIDLPHDFRLDLGYSDSAAAEQGYLPDGVAWYRKTFALPHADEGRHIVLEFDGVMRACSVWFNGCFLGEHLSGYSGFEMDISESAKFGDEGLNVLLVRVDTTTGAEGWWYEGGGIYRHVWLTKTEQVHIERWGVHVQAHPEGESADVLIHTTVQNDLADDASVIVNTHLIAPDGTCIPVDDVSVSVDGLGRATAHQRCRIKHARRWDITDPALYKAVVALHRNGVEIDRYETPFGIRDFSYTPQGLILNGRLVQIKGACVHLDFAGVGTAQHDEISAYKIKRLRDMGCNAYRSSHNPATIELLDECDRQGMIVLDENRVAETAKYRLEDLEELIKRGRNHPSILFWSLSNEAGNSGSPQTGRAIRRLIALVRKLDPDRIVLSAEANMFGEEAVNWARENYGIYGFNYPEALLDNVLYKQAREADPELMIMSTENVSHLITRGAYADDPERGHCSQYGTAYDQSGKTGSPVAGGAAFPWQAMDFYRENPGTGGHFIWTGFDYRGETTPFFNAQSISNYGVMDYCGFPKDTYYYYQSIFQDEAMIHITPHWTYPKPIGEEVELRIFTNCDEVEMILNGRSLGKKEKKGHWSQWNLPFEPGILEAVGYRNGIEMIRDRQITAGEPAFIHLSANKAHAHAGDIVFVTARVEDAYGNVVPYAENKVSFCTEGGKIIGTGNGDPGSFEDDLLPERKAFGGLCMALVMADEDEDSMTVSAQTDGLEIAQIRIGISAAVQK